MNKVEKIFPIYRKYAGINVWFKILSDKEFIEVKEVGLKKITTHVVAAQYPEMLLIQDMIACHQGRWEDLNENIFINLSN